MSASKEIGLGLLSKIGSLIVHADEFMSEGGHAVDRQAFQAQMNDPEIAGFLEELRAASLLPVKRS